MTAEGAVLQAKWSGEFAPVFWTMVVCMVLAFALLVFGRKLVKGRVITLVVIASLLVDFGMWLERFTIVVPTETRPQLGLYTIGVYQPTWTEWSITAATFAGFALLYVLFVKLFPIISIWEVQEAPEAIPSIAERLRSYLPGAAGVSAMSESSGQAVGGGE